MKDFMLKGLTVLKGSNITQWIPYAFSIVLTLISLLTTRNINFVLSGFVELLLIFTLVNLLFSFKAVVANIVRAALLFVYNIQMACLLFSGTYISLIMVTNLHSLKALSGKAILYVSAAILLIIFSLFPTKKFPVTNRMLYIGLGILSLLEIGLVSASPAKFSPLNNLYQLSNEYKEHQEAKKRIASLPNYVKTFYREDVGDAVTKPRQLPNKPNVILIFTEGLSQNIINDKRQIMPNITAVQKSSLNFENYFNHTFATYRGIQGQLFSGYQLEDQDPNHLISIQSILRENGYSTTFINSEPHNEVFTNYLADLNFDNLVTGEKFDGAADSVSDKDMYRTLFTLSERLDQSNTPFFLSMYTFETHVSLDSSDDKFKDGKNPLLNRFYNLDNQFKWFIDKFNKSKLADNTIIVFTSDHASFVDSDYKNSFVRYKRNNVMVDEVPFFIYYKGISPETIDVHGKNSLGVAPTILDYIDISAPNYFLGNSLFDNQSKGKYDTVFVSEVTKLSTANLVDGTHIQSLPDSEKEKLDDAVEKYYAAKKQIP